MTKQVNVMTNKIDVMPDQDKSRHAGMFVAGIHLKGLHKRKSSGSRLQTKREDKEKKLLNQL